MELKDYTTEELRAELKKRNAEERAKEYASDTFDPDYILPVREKYLVNIQRQAYIAGAKDQKAIDIDNAKSAFNKACGWLSTYTWYSEVFDEFMKNMEE